MILHCSNTMFLSTKVHHHPFLLPRNASSFPRLIRPQKLPFFSQSRRSPSAIKSLHKGHEQQQESKPTWENVLSTAASLYPVYVTVGGAVACVKPSAFSWFVQRGPASYSISLGFIMLAMGLTLELRDLIGIFVQRPLSILFGCVAQYSIMPAFGAIIGKVLGLQPSLSVGLILLGCCPGGTASNVVTLIARGDVPLSIVMTVCTTLGAVVLTPFLTKTLAGAFVPVDAWKLSVSTLQVVVAPILLGSYMQRTFPNFVKMVTPLAPLLAVLTSSLLASSVFSENVIRLKSSMLSTTLASGRGPLTLVQEILSGELGIVILSVLLLHFAGFFVGYDLITSIKILVLYNTCLVLCLLFKCTVIDDSMIHIPRSKCSFLLLRICKNQMRVGQAF